MGASAGGPHGWVGAQSAMSSALVGVIVARWKSAMDGQPKHIRYRLGMTPEEMADLVHLRRARDFMDRSYAEPLDVPTMASAALDVARGLLAPVPAPRTARRRTRIS